LLTESSILLVLLSQFNPRFPEVMRFVDANGSSQGGIQLDGRRIAADQLI
jgi:hypothetical protein